MKLYPCAVIFSAMIKPRGRALCNALEFRPEVKQLVLDRFYDGKYENQCLPTPKQQRRMMRIINKDVLTFSGDNPAFYTETEIENMLGDGNVASLPERVLGTLRSRLKGTDEGLIKGI